MDCSPPGSSAHGIFQARVLEWVDISFSRDLPDLGIEPRSLALQADTFTLWATRKADTKFNFWIRDPIPLLLKVWWLWKHLRTGISGPSPDFQNQNLIPGWFEYRVMLEKHCPGSWLVWKIHKNLTSSCLHIWLGAWCVAGRPHSGKRAGWIDALGKGLLHSWTCLSPGHMILLAPLCPITYSFSGVASRHWLILKANLEMLCLVSAFFLWELAAHQEHTFFAFFQPALPCLLPGGSWPWSSIGYTCDWMPEPA